jgi:branched-subunit amino acid transport protein
MYVNLVLAIPTAAGAIWLLRNEQRLNRPRIDVPGTLAACAGLFAVVYGFSRAETDGWGSAPTLGFLAAGVALLVAFAAIERRAAEPLLPPRVVLDRNRGGSYLAVGIVGVGMYGAFFFLTFYLQQTLGFSPIKTGFAFLPMIVAVVLTASMISSVLLPRTGPRPLITAGMVLAAAGSVLLAQLGVDSGYAGHVLPALILVGIGLGLVIAPSINTATLGVSAADAGVASASVNTMQQIGGSLGTALLSTLAASAVTHFVSGKAASPALAADAAVHGYATAFLVSAAIFAVGAIVTFLVLRPGRVEVAAVDAVPVGAH